MGHGFCSQCGGTYTDRTRPGCASCVAYKKSIGAVPAPVAEPGQPNAAILKLAFWEAMKRCDTDERVHDMDMPCFSRSGDDQLIDGYLPDQVWEHMAAAVSELRDAAGLGG